MRVLATRIENQAGRSLCAEKIFEIARARERSLSRLLILYLTTGFCQLIITQTFRLLEVARGIKFQRRSAHQQLQCGAASGCKVESERADFFVGLSSTPVAIDPRRQRVSHLQSSPG
jgi:hypothetical protein